MSEKKQQNYPSVKAFINSACLLAETPLERVVIAAGLGHEIMAKQVLDGLMKMPITWIKPVSDRLNFDVGYFLRIWMTDYMPEVLALLDEVAEQPLLTQNERKLITSLREHTDGTDAQAIVADGRDLIAVVMV